MKKHKLNISNLKLANIYKDMSWSWYITQCFSIYRVMFFTH